MKRLFAIILFIISVCLVANADDNKTFVKSGNTYTNSSTGREKSNSQPVATEFTWKDSKGVEYPIYISSTGSCYVIKISKKTNKEYKHYLGPEISKDICDRLGIEYKGKKK